MIQRAHDYGKLPIGTQSKLQLWMFTDCQAELLSFETKLISNKFSSVTVVNFMLSMQKPSKLTLQNADRML